MRVAVKHRGHTVPDERVLEAARRLVRGVEAEEDLHALRAGGDEAVGERLRLRGVEQAHSVTDRLLAGYVATKKRGPLFNTTPDKVRGYLSQIGFGDYLVKDFRTYVANDEALAAIEKMPRPANAREYKRAVKTVCERVAAKLGNQWTMARDSYIQPEVFHLWAA